MTFALMNVLSRTASSSSTATRSSMPKGHHSNHSHAEHHKNVPLPFLASPVDPEALKWLAKKKRSSTGVQRATTVAAYEADRSESALAKRIFRKQHEASTLELFFDLFFVANLAVFTTKSAHVDLQSLSNYVGFFAILWTTWFHFSMYDVRFYVDCVFTRLCKFIGFGVMVSFVALTSLYDSILTGGMSRAFHGVALLLFGSRILFVLQYGVVLYFVRAFDKTLIPMLLTMSVYTVSGFGFLATWLQDRNRPALSGPEGVWHVRIWYGIICAEAVLIIVIACIWRILSFKHTHLVERVGLLSLIIMGEGIIGLVKSTSYIVGGTMVTVWQETGIVASAVLIIYLIYVLYFDNIDHHRFGTIQQQIWTLLHFPAHVAILLTVEGSTALLIWNACRSAIAWIVEDTLPSVKNPMKVAGTGKTLATLSDFVSQVNYTYTESYKRYYYKNLTEYYPTFATDLAKLSKPKADYGTDAFTAEVGPTLKKMTDYFTYFIYQNFAAEGPTYKLKKEPDYSKKVRLYEDGFKVTLCYFYVAAGALLILLALLYSFGRQRKTRTEWVAIGIRLFAGMCLPVMIVSPLLEKPGTQDSFRFEFSYILIPIVALAFLVVVIVDNVIKAISERHYTIVEERRMSRMSSYDTKGPQATEEERELTDEDSSYDVHRQGQNANRMSTLSSASTGSMDHGSPELVQAPYANTRDDASLIGNAQRRPTVTFSDMANRKSGYAKLDDEPEELDELPRYGGGEELSHFRTESMRQH